MGVVIYEFLTGTSPFAHEEELTIEDLFQNIIDDEPVLDDTAAPYTSYSARVLVKRLLLKAPEDRLCAKEVLMSRWVKVGFHYFLFVIFCSVM